MKARSKAPLGRMLALFLLVIAAGCDGILGIEGFTAGCIEGQRRCTGNTLETCDKTFQWQRMDCGEQEQTCIANPIAHSAACMGECSPGKRCLGNTPQACNDQGKWKSEESCAPIEICSGGNCKCFDGDLRCHDNTPQQCVGAQWQNIGNPCENQTCDAATVSCVGQCAPGSRCSENTPQTCNATGEWESAMTCEFACVNGQCARCTTECVAPTPICDILKDKCVECLQSADCILKPGTLCSGGACACPTHGDSYCREPDRCVDLQTNSADCGMCDHPCFGACAAGKCQDAWEPTPLKDAPGPRASHVAVWTGSKMIVWGGDIGFFGNTNTGGMLDLAGYHWDPTSMENAPAPRKDARAVWTGIQMVVWGGDNGGPLNTGALFDPATNTWMAMSTVGAPSPRYGHTIVWTGLKVIIWGGTDGNNYFDDGAAYDIGADAWEPISSSGELPSPRAYHSSVWTGSRMVVFGGFGFNGIDFGYLGDGAEFDPVAGSWVTVKDGQPPPRAHHGSTWTGVEMIIWGGQDANGLSAMGARYTPTIEWVVMTSNGSPELRQFHSLVWIAPRLIVWGGQNAAGVPLDSGSFYVPSTDAWSTKPIPSGPSARTQHSSVNANGKLIVFGGYTPVGLTFSGGILDPSVL